MNLLELIRVGLSQLRANPLRSLLTILGITIGVGSVVGVVSIGEGLRRNVVSEFSQVGGAKLIIVQPPRSWEIKGGRRIRRTWEEHLTETDLRAIRAESDRIESAFPVIGWNAQIRYRKASATGEIQGTLPGYHHAMDWQLEQGRFLSDWDAKEWRRVCVIGDKIKQDLFGDEPALGKEIKLNGERYTVVGQMKPRIFFGRDWGNQVLIPITTLQKRITGNDRYNIVFAYLKNTADVRQATRDIRRVLKRLHRHGDEFRIDTGEGVLQNVERVILILKIAAGGIAAISLVVGGIGIMNIMLVSVTERTREIGIRKAVGAKQRHILIQFLVESLVLSLFGGLLGVGCGLGLGFGLSWLIEYLSTQTFPSVVSPVAIALALCCASGIGVFFGVYPAVRASRLNPVEALRRE